MEGILTVPPERGTIIGRAIWKSRYVVVGGAQKEQTPQRTGRSMAQVMSSSRTVPTRNGSPRGLPNNQPDAVYLSIYRDKSDWEPIQQHALGSITDCQIQMLAHRKQGPVLPTLVVSINPDPATDKLRKRRSSRTAGLTTHKETAPTTLWFRPEKEHQNILPDWLRCIQSQMQPKWNGPLSPMSPGSPTFANPFSPRSREASDFYHRPGSGNPNSRSTLSHKASTQTQNSRDRPVTYSESPSLRSKRSDLSHASSVNPHHVAYGAPGYNFTMPSPADLPSPATTVGEYQGELIGGWTSAQGRSSTISSPVRGRGSVSSQQQDTPQHPVMNPSSTPITRETILDRAFQLRCIPGSDSEIPGEEKLTSLARFDALMRQVDEKRQREKVVVPNAQPEGLKSAWDPDDDSDSDCSSNEAEDIDKDEDEDEEDTRAGEADIDDSGYMPSKSQRALHFIAARHDPLRQAAQARSPASPTAYNTENLKALNSGYSHLRPHTGYAKHRPAIAQRTHSQPQLAANSPVSSTLDVPSSSSAKTSEDGNSSLRSGTEKRQSTSSTKRLSFTEFTKRLSSTSSLLLVQTNTSGGSNRGSGEIESTPVANRTGQRGGPASPSPTDWDKRCGWRGSVGVFGAERGFL